MNRSPSPRRPHPVNNPRMTNAATTHLNAADFDNMQPITNNVRRARRQVAGTEVSDSTPLMDTENINPRPPIANPENDEDFDDDREVINTPYPGVDDGFFTPANGNKVPEVEIIPDTPVNNGRPQLPGDNIPRDRTPDRTPDRRPSLNPHFPENYPEFPYAPGFGGGNTPGIFSSDYPDSIPDVNVYQHKKTVAQGMLDLALFSANANQLRYVLESYERHPYYYPSVVFISISLLLQVAIGVGLIWNSRYNVKDDKQICIANKISNFTIIGIFIVTVVNVFISAFGVANPVQTQIQTPAIGPRFGNFEDDISQNFTDYSN